MSEIENRIDEISLKEIIIGIRSWVLFLFSKWKPLVLIGLVGSFLGLGYSMWNKPVYVASTNFVLEDGESGKVGGLGSLGGLASMAGINLGGSGGGMFQGDNIIELYKSRKMIEQTLLSEVEIDGKKQLLIERYLEFGKEKKEKEEIINFRTAELGRKQDSLITKVVKQFNSGVMKVSKPDKKLSIVKVEVSHEDEIFAKIFNEKIVSNVNDFYVETKTKKASENLAVVQKQTDSVRNELYGAITRTATVSDATPNLNPTRQVLRTSMQRSQFTAEASKAVLSTLLQNLELAKLTLLNQTPLIQVIDHPVFPLEVKRIGKAKAMIIGGIIFGLAGIFVFVIRRILNNLLND